MEALAELAAADAARTEEEKADVRLATLAASIGPLRRVQAAIAARLLETGSCEQLCFARAGDYSRERPGMSRRQLQELARVHRALQELPALQAALVQNELPWSKVRTLARVATATDERQWIDRARALPCRRLEEEVRASSPASMRDEESEQPRRRVRVPCTPATREKWERAHETAERVAGQRLGAGDALELALAEVVSELPIEVEETPSERPARSTGHRHRAAGLEHTPPRARAGALPVCIAALVEDLDAVGPRELDRRLCRTLQLEQQLDATMAPLLRVVRCAEYEWSGGYQTLAHFAREQLGMAPSKARALVRLERASEVCPELREAYRSGKLSWVKAQCLLPLLLLDVPGGWRRTWVAWARQITLRRLEADVRRALLLRAGHPEAWQRCQADPACTQDALPQGERQVCAQTDPSLTDELVWHLPPSVASLFDGLFAALGRDLDALLDRALDAWGLRDPSAPRPDPVIVRDGYRCAVPGCSARRNLHDHHIHFRSAGGSDAPENRITLCAFHHQRCLHAGRMQIRGRAPDGLVFELPFGRYRSGDIAIAA